MARDHRRTMAQRNALAYAQGYRGKGGGEAGAYAAKRAARETGALLPGDTTAQPERRQITRIGTSGRRLVRDLPEAGRGSRVLASQLGKADRVQITATTKDGRVVNVLSKGGMSAAKFLALVDEHGSIADAVAHLAAVVYGQDAGIDGGDDLEGFSLDLS